MGRTKGSKNKPKTEVVTKATKAVKKEVKPLVTEEPKQPGWTKEKVDGQPLQLLHPIRVAAQFIAKNMSGGNEKYWLYEANKREYKLDQMIASYLINDFGIKDLTIEQLYSDKSNTQTK